MDKDLQKYVAAIALEWATQHCEQVETPARVLNGGGIRQALG